MSVHLCIPHVTPRSSGHSLHLQLNQTPDSELEELRSKAAAAEESQRQLEAVTKRAESENAALQEAYRGLQQEMKAIKQVGSGQ